MAKAHMAKCCSNQWPEQSFPDGSFLIGERLPGIFMADAVQVGCQSGWLAQPCRSLTSHDTLGSCALNSQSGLVSEGSALL